MNNKTKLGVSLALFSACIYFVALFSSYIPLLLLVGYVLLREDNLWLKQNAVKAVVIVVFFDLISSLIGFIPDTMSVINGVIGIFGSDSINVPILNKIISLVKDLLYYAEKVILILLGFMSLKMGFVRIGFIDNIIAKHMAQNNQ